MVVTTDKAGQTVYVTYIPDCEDNAGGFYCETYADENFDRKIDDFCFHPEDANMTEEGIKDFIRDYYKEITLDLNYEF